MKAQQTTSDGTVLVAPPGLTLPAAPSFISEPGSDSYVPTLWKGHIAPGVGSKQLPLGGDPIYQRWLVQILPTTLSNMNI